MAHTTSRNYIDQSCLGLGSGTCTFQGARERLQQTVQTWAGAQNKSTRVYQATKL